MGTLLPRITLVQSPTIPGEMEKMWVETSVELTDGRRATVRCRGPKGFWGLPLTRDEHLVKVRDCLGMRLSKVDCERCIQLVDSLDRLDHNGVRELMAITSAEDSGI